MKIVVGNGDCVGDPLWTSIWCKRIWNDGSISSKIMDSFIPNCTCSSSCVCLHNPNFDTLRPRWKHIRSCRKHFSLVNSYYVCFYCLIHLPNIPSITKQEHHHCILGSFFNNHSCIPLLAFDNEIPTWDCWCNDFNYFGILDSQHWSAHICYMWLVSWNMERFLIFSIQRSLACCQTFPFSWCNVVVSSLQM